MTPESSVRNDDPDLLTRTSWTNAGIALTQIRKVRTDSIYLNVRDYSKLNIEPMRTIHVYL